MLHRGRCAWNLQTKDRWKRVLVGQIGLGEFLSVVIPRVLLMLSSAFHALHENP
jgi:hypothetical protein